MDASITDVGEQADPHRRAGIPDSRPPGDDTPGDGAPAPADPAPPERRPRYWPAVALLVTGGALLWYLSWGWNRVVGFGWFQHPPVYGQWVPVTPPSAAWAVLAGVLLAGLAGYLTTGRRVPTWVALALLVAGGVATAALVAATRGEEGLVRGVALPPVGAMRYYNSDVHLVDVYGVLGFDRRYPDLGFAFSAYNTRTHPPGVIVLLSVLYRAWGSEPWWRLATVLAVLSMLAAVCAWAMGRVLGGDRAGRIAAALLVAAPGPLLLAYTAMDAIFATAMTAGMALAMVAIRRRSAAWAAGAGAVLAGTTYLTYATVFVVLAVTLAVLVQVRRPLPVLRMLGAAGAAGLLTLGLLRVGLDYDLLASYHAVPSASRPYDPYWIAGSPAAWLVFAGLPLAALGITGLFRRYPPARRPVLGAILIGLMLVWAALPGSVTHLRPGEVERTWAFLYPVLAASAGPLVERWTRDRGWVAGAMVGTLVLLSVFQALVIQNFWDTFY